MSEPWGKNFKDENDKINKSYESVVVELLADPFYK